MVSLRGLNKVMCAKYLARANNYKDCPEEGVMKETQGLWWREKGER